RVQRPELPQVSEYVGIIGDPSFTCGVDKHLVGLERLMPLHLRPAEALPEKGSLQPLCPTFPICENVGRRNIWAHPALDLSLDRIPERSVCLSKPGEERAPFE